MKPPTAPPLYPELPAEDGQNYRLQKISEIEQKLSKERNDRKAIYKKYYRAVNVADGVDTTLISVSVILAGLGIIIPLELPLEIVAVVCGLTGVCVRFIKRKLNSKARKHDDIKVLAESKMDSVRDLISKALQDGQISEIEYKIVLDEMEKYGKMKEEIRKKGTEIDKNKLIQQGREEAMSMIKKKLS